jgi:hypothetical protein
MLDINLFRTGATDEPMTKLHWMPDVQDLYFCWGTAAEKGGDPELVRESQRRRYADVGLVDKVIELDNEWRNGELQVVAVLHVSS